MSIITPPEEQQIRMQICKTCSNFNPIGKRCKLCGCIMPVKSRLASATCKIGLWKNPEVVENAKESIKRDYMG